jgi:hypothetical protein
MQSTQLTCPYCGSSLNFSVEIVAGTPVECLICMRTFAAASPVAVPCSAAATVPERMHSIDSADPPTLSDPLTDTIPAATAQPAKAKRAPQAEVLVAKPYAAPSVSTIAEKSVPTPTAGPTPRKPEESAAGKSVALIAVTAGLLLLLTVGLVFAAWKITTGTRTGVADPQYAANSNAKSSNEPDKQKAGDPADEEDDEDLRTKIQEEVKQVLKRKTSTQSGGKELEVDPIATLNFNKQPIVGLDQEKINAAIAKGVAYLKRTQNPDGAWHGGHGVGYAAIGGLTLLECNTPVNDPAVLNAAAFVRSHSANLGATYELSLAVLFLDRLGDPRDRPLIQGMALRLLAGQTDSGGWSYDCPLLTPMDMVQLYNFLQSNKQPNLLNPLGGKAKTQAGITINPTRDPKNLNDPFQHLGELILTQGIEGGRPDPKKVGPAPPTNPDAKNPPDVKPNPGKPKLKPIRPEALNPNLRNLPIVQNQGMRKGQTKLRRGAGDNSNTQFALLALWAARRYDVPSDQALLASYQRFIKSQNTEGGWGYLPARASTNTMTNVGLLGLATGHGAAPEVVNFNPKNPKEMIVKPALQDPKIQKGLKAISRHIGQPILDPNKASFPMQNLYFLWSVERVAMLYDLKTIGGKDWYGWGAQILVHHQRLDGDWPSPHYPGASAPLNTCFALLFLRRSNLVQDLTNNLRLRTGIRDPEK